MEVINPLKYCRYYKGEDECNDMRTQGYWSVERIWVKLVNPDEGRRHALVQEFVIDFPLGIPSADIPLSLKATLYDQYCHFNDGYKDGFINYIRDYLSY